jgi:2Fe-2S ferredoxin
LSDQIPVAADVSQTQADRFFDLLHPDTLTLALPLEIATLLAKGIEIDHACGGVVACSTCHIVVKKGFGSCSEATDDEEDMLDEAPALTSQSRLACQCELKDLGEGKRVPIVVRVPSWNRNAVKEIPH